MSETVSMTSPGDLAAFQIQRCIGGWSLKFTDQFYDDMAGEVEIFIDYEKLIKRLRSIVPEK